MFPDSSTILEPVLLMGLSILALGLVFTLIGLICSLGHDSRDGWDSREGMSGDGYAEGDGPGEGSDSDNVDGSLGNGEDPGDRS